MLFFLLSYSTFVPTLIEESMDQKEKRLYQETRYCLIFFVQFGLRQTRQLLSLVNSQSLSGKL